MEGAAVSDGGVDNWVPHEHCPGRMSRLTETWVTEVKAGLQQRVLAQRQGMEGPLLTVNLFAPECPAVSVQILLQ